VLDALLDAIDADPVTYVVLFAIVLVDDFVFFAPGDTAMISAGILASNGGLELPLVILAGAMGGLAGDNIFYWLGRRFGPGLADRFLGGERGARAYAWGREQLHHRGATIIVIGRFIPAGRTATTFAAGTAGLAYRRFIGADAVAAVAWASYTALLGYAGGSAFEDAFWQPLAIGLGLALVLGLVVEAVTTRRRRSAG
jgi:membrane protein DedA with SNARE-associated domain